MNLTRFQHELIVLLGLQITSCLVMSGAKIDQILSIPFDFYLPNPALSLSKGR
jgi:hypothetical protein